jgi:hypothetical protein
MQLIDIKKVKWSSILLLFVCLFCCFQKTTLSNDGWEVLFDGKNIDKWRSTDSDTFPSNAWSTSGGNLFIKDNTKGADIITREEYTNFELVFDFNLTDSANSGVKYLVEKLKITILVNWCGTDRSTRLLMITIILQ